MTGAPACSRAFDGLCDAVGHIAVCIIDAHQAVALADIAAGNCRAIHDIDAIAVPAQIALHQARQFASVTLGRHPLAGDLSIVTTAIQRAASRDTARSRLRIEAAARGRGEALHWTRGALTRTERVTAAAVALDSAVLIGCALVTWQDRRRGSAGRRCTALRGRAALIARATCRGSSTHTAGNRVERAIRTRATAALKHGPTATFDALYRAETLNIQVAHKGCAAAYVSRRA